MRVLQLSSESSWRGGEQQIAYLIEELPKSGVECFVACRKGSAFEDYCRINQVPFIALPFANSLDLYTARQLKKYCDRHHIQLVHAHSGLSHSVAVWAHLLGNKLPIVLHRRVDFPVKDKWLTRYKYNYAGIEKIICVSDAVKEITARSLHHPGRCLTIYDGIDLSRFSTENQGILHRELGLPAERKLIANVAALAPHKDYYTFLDTAALLLQEELEATILIIGSGPMETELKAYAAQKGVADKVKFLGFRTDVPQILPELDVLLMTSKTEGLGSTILDAFASKVPVVATAAGGIPELVKHRQTGMLAPVGNAAELAAHVREVLAGKRLADSITETAFRQLPAFSKETTAAQTAAVYRELASR
jgi:glycosyltransferase involved in cell wall biosynthesis